MKTTRILFFAITLLSLACQSKEELTGDVLITSTNIIDVKTGAVIPEQDVLIGGKKIKSIRPSGQASYEIKNEISGTGKFLIPGLWDMHAHPDDPEVWRMNPKDVEKDRLLPLFVVNGVTGIRDMAGDLSLVIRWRNLYAEGRLLAPKIYAGGPLLDGPNPMWDGSVGIDGPEQVKLVVDSLIHEEVDFLKVYSLLPRDTYLELSRYANEIDFPFVGHVPFTVLPSEAAKTGMKSQEHLLEILKECAQKPSESFLQELRSMGNGLDRSNKLNDFRLENFNPAKADSLYTLFEETNTWHCPTLSMWYKNAWYEDEKSKDEHLTQLLPPYLRAYWTPKHNDHLQFRDNEEFLKIKQRLYQLYLKMVGAMHEKGVPLLAGTDMGANPLCHPGVGVHNELMAFTEAGLSPLEALRTATWNPALFFEIEEDYGSVSEGKTADLVLLNANPLENIQNVSKIHAVFRDGTLIDSKAIDSIKSKIEQDNRGVWNNQ